MYEVMKTGGVGGLVGGEDCCRRVVSVEAVSVEM